MKVPAVPPPDDPQAKAEADDRRDKALDTWPGTVRYCAAVLAERAPAVLAVLLWFAARH